ncbi:MAG TPA: hypothetical protein PLB10_18485 [Thiolinea sp.]|nr:hypothetical protein [Thiolinea sp.]
MAFNALDSLLGDMQFNLVKQSNFDLPFGGTTDREFDFLSQAGAINKMAPNFLSFMAGIGGSNLATQANRELQFDRAKQLRELNSNLAYRGALTRNAGLEGDTMAARLPFVAPAAEADINRTNALTGYTDAQTAGQQLQNAYYPEATRADINYRDAQTAAQTLQNQYYPQEVQSQINSRNAQTGNLNARTAEQQFINDNLAARERLYIQDKNAQIARERAQTGYYNAQSGEMAQQERLMQMKADAFSAMNDLDTKYRNQQISEQTYQAQLAKLKADAFDAIREEESGINQGRAAAQNAMAAAGNARARYYDRGGGQSRNNQQSYGMPTVITPRGVQPPVPPTTPAATPSNYITQPGSTAVVPTSISTTTPVMRDYNEALGLPGITKRMVDMAMSGQVNALSGNPLTREEMQSMMAVQQALGY